MKTVENKIIHISNTTIVLFICCGLLSEILYAYGLISFLITLCGKSCYFFTLQMRILKQEMIKKRVGGRARIHTQVSWFHG